MSQVEGLSELNATLKKLSKQVREEDYSTGYVDDYAGAELIKKFRYEP